MVALDEARMQTIKEGLLHSFRSTSNAILLAQDSAESIAFMVSQLAYTEAQTYAREYQEAQFRQLVPITAEAGPDAATVRYQIYDHVGQGKRINGASKDIPTSDVSAGQVEIAVVDGGAAYRYSQLELIQAARQIRPLPAERMTTAIEMSERHLNQVAMVGERTDVAGQASFNGLLNYPGVTTINKGTAGFTGLWDTTATVDQVLADINNGIYAYWAGTNFVVLPNTIGMAPKSYAALNSRYNSLGTKRLIDLVLESNMTTSRTGEKLNIVPIYQADTAGAKYTGGAACPRNVFYRNDKNRMVMHVPMPIRFLAPQPEGLDIFVPGWYRYAGLNVRYIKTMVFQDESSGT
jgi:hypothetical protein